MHHFCCLQLAPSLGNFHGGSWIFMVMVIFDGDGFAEMHTVTDSCWDFG
jgi:hypothetical protein